MRDQKTDELKRHVGQVSEIDFLGLLIEIGNETGSKKNISNGFFNI
jgi:hypothetical protein